MKPLYSDEEINIIIADEPDIIITIILGLIDDYFIGLLDIDQLITLLENL